MKLRYLSVCSGIEAASVAWESLGWEAIGFSEIEPFPCKVLKTRFPNVPNFGDMNNYAKWPIAPGSVDVLIGGTPCQSFSVAGLRKGMVDPRGNLALVYIGLVNHVRPRWVIWENVPGVLSSDGGRDFGSLLGALDELGYGYAWRVLDAQYWGVAQRRRRVFLIGHLGEGSAASAVLFEQAGSSRNYPTRRQTGEGVTFSFEDSFGTSDEEGLTECSDVAPTLTHSGPPFSRTGQSSVETEALITCIASGQAGAESHDEIAPTLTGLHEVPILANKAICFRPGMTCRLGDPRLSDIAPTLTAQPGDNHPACVVPEPISFGDAAIKTTNHQGDRVVGDGDIFPTLSAQGANNGGGPGSLLYQHTRAAVRRLTPVECERLQGFPDNWTRIPWRGKDEENCPDGVRYKAVGNSMAVPVIRWLGQRIEMVEDVLKDLRAQGRDLPSNK